jgi:hypothetical protein
MARLMLVVVLIMSMNHCPCDDEFVQQPCNVSHYTDTVHMQALAERGCYD